MDLSIPIYQSGEEITFPLDLAHIRRIEYTNDAIGGKKPVDDLRATLEAVLPPTVKA